MVIVNFLAKGDCEPIVGNLTDGKMADVFMMNPSQKYIYIYVSYMHGN